MTKQELVQAVAGTTGCTTASVEQIINATLGEIRNAVERGEEVTLRGFGSFKPKACKARVARNIGTGESVRVAAHMKPSFKPAQDFVTETAKLAVV